MEMPIVLTEAQWRNSQLSVARYFGGCKFNGVQYVILNKEGKDLMECSYEAQKAGRDKAIEPGEPADLVNKKYQKEYRKLGRDKFFEKYNIRKEV
jgi:hypothetical protein